MQLLIDPKCSVTNGESVAVDLSGQGFDGVFRNPDGVETNLGSMDDSVLYNPDSLALDFVGYGSETQGYLQWDRHPLGGFANYALETWVKVSILQHSIPAVCTS